jgi:hypothetical protein
VENELAARRRGVQPVPKARQLDSQLGKSVDQLDQLLERASILTSPTLIVESVRARRKRKPNLAARAYVTRIPARSGRRGAL